MVNGTALKAVKMTKIVSAILFYALLYHYHYYTFMFILFYYFFVKSDYPTITNAAF